MALDFEVEGYRPKGRPKQQWKMVVERDMEVTALTPEDTADRRKWQFKSRKAEPRIDWDNS